MDDEDLGEHEELTWHFECDGEQGGHTVEMVIVGMCGEAQGISGSLGLINEPQVNLSLGDSQVLREWVEAAKFVFFLDCQDKSSLRINVWVKVESKSLDISLIQTKILCLWWNIGTHVNTDPVYDTNQN